MPIVCAMFLARVRPDSSSAKPACMNITKNAAISVQTRFNAVCVFARASESWSALGAFMNAGPKRCGSNCFRGFSSTGHGQFLGARAALASAAACLLRQRTLGILSAMRDRASAEDNTASVPIPVSNGFRASLTGACLPDLVQMACLSRTEGAFRVISNGRIGYLFFRSGQVVHAMLDDLAGLPAALELLSWDAGTFEPSNMSWPDLATIDLGWQNLILLSARQRDESRRHRVPPPKPSVTPRTVRPAPIAIAAVKAAPPASPGKSANQEPIPPSQSPLIPVNLIEASVRLDARGSMVSGRGAAEELAEVAGYAARLSQLIGEAFGMDGFSALESVHDRHRRLICVDASGGLIALTAAPQADLQALRAKFGL